MPTQLNKVWLYRIVHIDNLQYLLQNGIFHKASASADPNYINIGDSTLISQRNDYEVPINPPNGVLGDYVPFYFGPLSPMLLNIKTGYRGITKRPQQDIVYICCSVDNIIDECEQWCFTDGHAKNAITTFYNNIENLTQVDFEIASSRYWQNTDDDFDRMRKKQAEFLVKYCVLPKSVSNIVVCNEFIKDKVEALIKNLNLNIKVHINPSNKFYY